MDMGEGSGHAPPMDEDADETVLIRLRVRNPGEDGDTQEIEVDPEVVNHIGMIRGAMDVLIANGVEKIEVLEMENAVDDALQYAIRFFESTRADIPSEEEDEELYEEFNSWTPLEKPLRVLLTESELKFLDDCVEERGSEILPLLITMANSVMYDRMEYAATVAFASRFVVDKDRDEVIANLGLESNMTVEMIKQCREDLIASEGCFLVKQEEA